MTYSPQIAAEIRAEMGRQRYGVMKLATTTGIPRSRLHRKLSGRSPLDTDEVGIIATALGLSMTDLIARAERAA